MNLKSYHLILCKRFNKLKTVDSQTYGNKALKQTVLDDSADLFNELYYIYKDKYNEEKDGLNTKDQKKVESEEEKEEKKKKKNNRLVKHLIKTPA